MIYQQDWMMRQIEMIVEALLRVLFHKESIEAEQNVLIHELRELLRAGEICRAEDLLYEKLDPEDNTTLETAVWFYRELNALSDAELEAGDFSREEILSGLTDICRRYGLRDMLTVWLADPLCSETD